MVDVQNKSNTICAVRIRRNMASGYTVEYPTAGASVF